MAILSRPVGYGSLAVLAAAALWWVNSDPPTAQAKGSSTKPAPAKSSAQAWDFPIDEASIQFERPKDGLRNIFKPLLYVDKTGPKVEQEDLMKIPANLAQGEASWAYTGMVEVNGIRLALLENSSTHQGGYVKEGEFWKKSRIVRITSASIVLAGPDGNEETVFRYNPNFVPKVKPPADGGFTPVDLGPALKGPIGPNIEITRTDVAAKAAPPEFIVDK